MDMAEVDGVDQRNIKNWSNDVFADIYSTKLPLGEIYDLVGVDKRRGYYKSQEQHSRVTIPMKH